MFAVIFEVQPRPERREDYLALGRLLRPELEKIDGFIGNERYAGVHGEGLVLSLSIWRDEKALIRWRTFAIHNGVQVKGRSGIFRDYRLRIGEIAETGRSGGEAPRWQRVDETETGAAKVVTIGAVSRGAAGGDSGDEFVAALGVPATGTHGVVEQTLFHSLNTPGNFVHLVSWLDALAAAAWKPGRVAGEGLTHRSVRIIRDYGMFDRHEAPQYYPPVRAGGGPVSAMG
jgi:heme-degrading monooxygenase HmoA